MFRNLALDLRCAWRSYRRQPTLIAMAVLMLALGIGANTAVFSIAHGVLIKPLSYSNSDRLASLWPETEINKLIAHTVAQRAESFSAISVYARARFAVGVRGDPVMIEGANVGTDHFEVLRSAPLLGRTFTSAESQPGLDRVVVLSHGLWQRHFGGDPNVIGSMVTLDGELYTVIGVMPANYQALNSDWEIWTPLPIDPTDGEDYLGSFYLNLIGRLDGGTSLAAAAAELQSLVTALRSEYPNLITREKVEGARAIALREQLVGEVRPSLAVLLAAVAIVLLIACGNVANLLLARAIGRRREMAIRTVLGAGPWRIARQVLTESLALSLLGGIAAIILAGSTMKFLIASLPTQIPRAGEIGIDGPVLAFALLASLVAAGLAGVAPARRVMRLDPQEEIKHNEAPSRSIGRSGRGTGLVLVTAQVAAATALLIAAGLMLKSLTRLQAVDYGFRAENLLTLRADLVGPRYADNRRIIEYYRQALERISALPGVMDAGGVHLLPLTLDNWHFPYLAEDHPVPADAPPGTALPDADFRIVTPNYFRTMGISLRNGRTFTEGDHENARPVGIINRTMAEQLWPNGGAIGKMIRLFGDGGPEFTVIGVVNDTRHSRLDAAPTSTIYRPLAQWPVGTMHLMVRTAVPASSLALAVRASVREVDPEVPVSQMRPMVEVVRSSIGDERFTSFVTVAFACLALLLTLLGVYGVVSYLLARRTREIGIRMALGAHGRDVLRHILREGIVVVGTGVSVGLVVAVAGTKVLTSQLYEVSTLDAVTFGGSAALVGIAALGSYWLPAWRATRIQPISALRTS